MALNAKGHKVFMLKAPWCSHTHADLNENDATFSRVCFCQMRLSDRFQNKERVNRSVMLKRAVELGSTERTPPLSIMLFDVFHSFTLETRL